MAMGKRFSAFLLIATIALAISCTCASAQDSAKPADVSEEDIMLSITEGEASFNVANQDADKFKVQTPSGVVAVRGTDFTVNVDKEGKAQVHVLDGVVALLNDVGEVLLEKGMMSDLLKGALPEIQNFDLDKYKEVLDLWQGGLTKGKVRDFVKQKVKDEVKKQVIKGIGK